MLAWVLSTPLLRLLKSVISLNTLLSSIHQTCCFNPIKYFSIDKEKALVNNLLMSTF